MIHHVSLGTNDLKRAKAFYDPLMSLIGFRLLKLSDNAAHYGASDIVFSLETPVDGLRATPGNGAHIAFHAPDRKTVRRFHEAAIANEGTDEGRPGIRGNYNANYYGAFVRDLDGDKIEAVTYTARLRSTPSLAPPIAWRSQTTKTDRYVEETSRCDPRQ